MTKGNKIFESIKRLKEDLSKNLSAEVLEYLNGKKVISEFKYEFYSDTLRKRALSQKQLVIREKINQKFLHFTSYETNSFFGKISTVLKWAENNKWFDATFIHSLKKICEQKREIVE